MDLSPARVTGPVTLKKARGIWRDGVLYIFTGAKTFTAYSAPDKPVKVPGKNAYEVAGFTVERSGCKCGCPWCKTATHRVLAYANAKIESGEAAILEPTP